MVYPGCSKPINKVPSKRQKGIKKAGQVRQKQRLNDEATTKSCKETRKDSFLEHGLPAP